MSKRRLRVVGWNVQPVLLTDDGENLVPFEVQAVHIPSSDWSAWKAGGDESSLSAVRAQVEGEQDASGPPSSTA